MPETKIIATTEVSNYEGAYKTTMKSSGHVCIADEPLAVGGNNEGPAPGEYVCMALASCKAITLRMYIDRKSWAVGEIEVKVSLSKAEGSDGIIHTFYAEVYLAGAVSNEQKERLLHIAKACPLSKMLSKAATIITEIK